ncbi:hypothetical protein Ancab_012096 [Ancistrocladus abbreviatus]
MEGPLRKAVTAGYHYAAWKDRHLRNFDVQRRLAMNVVKELIKNLARKCERGKAIRRGDNRRNRDLMLTATLILLNSALLADTIPCIAVSWRCQCRMYMVLPTLTTGKISVILCLINLMFASCCLKNARADAASLLQSARGHR